MLPDVGDIAWMDLDPIIGTEQAGRRPALVLSDIRYHEVSVRAVVCPITSAARPWAFNVAIPNGLITTGVVLVDQVRTIDRTQRMFDIIERAPDDLLADVRGVLGALLGFDVISPIAESKAPDAS
jgi:mRNA interferase MazF